MIKYRLKFEFKKEDDVNLDRENHLNSLLSEIDSIVSDTPIRKPLDGETILISKIEYKVLSVVIAFEKEEDIVYHDFIILLENKKNAEDRKRKKDDDERRNMLEKMLATQREKESQKIKYDKYIDMYKQYPQQKYGNTDFLYKF